jgi:succinate dehydrogenase assembly factor 1
VSLYRQVLRAARAKPDGGGAAIAALARAEFDRHRAIDRKDFNRIEHLLRRGQHQLEMLGGADVTGVEVRRAGGAAERA